jgi:hypothetical protein
MVQPDRGEAVIVYDAPDEERIERTVANERIAYFQDHWILKLDEDEAGNDIVRRIPLQRVHYVDRSVEAFEDEVNTLRTQIQSFANDIQSTLFGGDEETERAEPYRIDIESESAEDDE